MKRAEFHAFRLAQGVCLCIALFVSVVLAGERFIAEHFTGGWGSSNCGPRVQAVGNGLVLCGDKQGNIYLAGSKNYQYIDLITPDGMKHHLAGTGEMGFKDGLARYAKFKMGIRGGEYGDAISMGCGPDGSIFMADNGNWRLRRIYKQGSEWYVETWVGGGTVSTSSISIGQTIPSKAIQLPNAFQFGVNSKGVVFIATDWAGNYKVNAAGDSITRIAGFTAADAYHPAVSPGTSGGALQRGVADTVGNVYFGTRSANRIFRIDSNGTPQHIGLYGVSKLSLPDTLPLYRGFDTMTGIAVAPDGTCVYVCGGDEYDIARVPTDLTTFTSTLAQNGFFMKATVGAGQANYLSDPSGTLKPEGALNLLTVCHLFGCDVNGSLYGGQYGWVLNGISIDGTRPQSSMFKLRRVVE